MDDHNSQEQSQRRRLLETPVRTRNSPQQYEGVAQARDRSRSPLGRRSRSRGRLERRSGSRTSRHRNNSIRERELELENVRARLKMLEKDFQMDHERRSRSRTRRQRETATEARRQSSPRSRSRHHSKALSVNAQINPETSYGSIKRKSCSTAMLCAAIMTEHWEHVAWEHAALAALANASNTALQWLLDEKVAKIEEPGRKGGGTFLVPMNGGIWTMCVSLEEEEISILSRAGFPKQPLCTNYLANSDDDEPRADWQHRMQNLSISCALVCLIVLGSAALVGAFGVCKHQISAVLVTGVMYLLAGLFAMFTLLIIHCKRIQRVSSRGSPHADDTADGVIGSRYPALSLLSAREFSTSWSLELGWGGVALATTTSLLWILLSKIMRYNPISAMLL